MASTVTVNRILGCRPFLANTFKSRIRYLCVTSKQTTCHYVVRGNCSKISHKPYFLMPARCFTTRPATTESGTVLSFSHNSQEFSFNATWLRENCRCDDCYNHTTQQRNILHFTLTPQRLQAEVVGTTPDSILIAWGDGHQSTYDLQSLSNNYLGNGNNFGKTSRILWDAATIQEQHLNPVSFPELMTETEGLKSLLSCLLKYGFALVSNCPESVEGTRKVAERVCFIKETLFGRGVWSFTSDSSRADTAYTNLSIGPHTDNTYFTSPSGIQMFHCLYHGGQGGETLLVDGFNAAESLRSLDPSAFEILQKYRIYHCYIEGKSHHSRSLGPILTTHPVSQDMEMIRYNHYDREPVSTVPDSDLQEYYSALERLSLLIANPDNQHWTKLSPGTVMLIDNWRVLHGRASFTGKRSMCGGYLPRDDWQGKARTLGLLH